MPDTNYPKEFLRRLKLRLPEMLSTLQRLVLAESPSLEKEPADLCCDLLAAEWHKRGASVERIMQKLRGANRSTPERAEADAPAREPH